MEQEYTNLALICSSIAETKFIAEEKSLKEEISKLQSHIKSFMGASLGKFESLINFFVKSSPVINQKLDLSQFGVKLAQICLIIVPYLSQNRGNKLLSADWGRGCVTY